MVKKKVSKNPNFNRNLLVGAVIIILIFVVAFNFAGKDSDEEGLAQSPPPAPIGGKSIICDGSKVNADDDCKDPKLPYCRIDRCVECKYDRHCSDPKNSDPEKPVCGYKSICRECGVDDDCKDSPKGPVCVYDKERFEDATNFRCAECRESKNCKQGYYCSEEEYKCKKQDCVTDADCVIKNPKFPYCIYESLSKGNLCGECRYEADCPKVIGAGLAECTYTANGKRCSYFI